MLAPLLRIPKGRRSERTPLLDALNKFRIRRADDGSEDDDGDEDVAHYDGEDEDDEDNGGSQRDGPLLPVFSEFLGISSPVPCLFTVLGSSDGKSTPFNCLRKDTAWYLRGPLWLFPIR